MMKINVIIPTIGLSGGIRVIFLYANYLVSQGHDVEFYIPMKAYKISSKKFSRLRSSLANTLKRGRVNWFNCKFKINVVPVIRNKYVRDADICIATAWPTAFDVYNLNLCKGIKVYFIQDYEKWMGNRTDIDNSYRLNLNRIVITNTLKKLLFDKFNSNSKVIYNGLDEKEFIIGEKKINNPKVILMLYNIAPNKGSEEGIEILKNVYRKYNIKVVLFGYKKSSSIPKDFEFYENPDREVLINLYRKSDIYLFPSKYESWGLPVMESMANKCAVIGNNVGCLKELGENNVNSITVDECDYNEIEKRLIELLKNDVLLKNIQNNAYKLVQKFKWIESYKTFENYLMNKIGTNVDN